MRKIIKRKIHISTHKRDLIDFINDEFYSHDKHNAFIEFTMKSLPTDNIIALFYFQKTKRYVETKAFVDGDKFTIEFDTSLINTDETVLGFIYFEKVAQSADVHRFSFGVKVSEIDKLHDIPIEEAKTKRVVAIEDIVTKAELDELFKRIEKNGGTYNDTEIRSSITSIEERVQTLEAKPDKDTIYDDSDVKSRLTVLETNASRYLTEHQPLTSIEERIQQVEARFNNLSNIYLSSHQSLAHLATKDALDKVEQRVEQLEQNIGSQPAVDNHDFLTRQELESKHYLTSVPEEVTNKISALETKVQTLDNKSVVTHEELEQAGYLKEHQPLTDYATNSKVESVESRVLALENKPSVVPQSYDDSGLKQRITNLENRPQVEAYNDADIKQRLTALEKNHVTKEELHDATELDETQFISPEELEAKHYLTTQQAESVYAKKSELYNDSALASRVSALESKQDNDTVYNDTEIKQRLTNLENHPQVDLTDYAKKSEIPQAYNDSELSRRVSVLETKEDKDTIYNDEEIKRRLTTLEAKPTVDVSGFAKKTEVPTVDSVNNLLRTQGEQATKITTLEAKSAYEIHGTGMPNGQVEAPIGTTYVDMSVTNGALKWIKQSGSGNTGWKVLIGDTGWRTLNSVSRAGNSFIKIRRVNNLVTYQFGGLQWGWFGVGRRNGPGFVRHNSSGDKGAKLTYPNGIPEGFRSENSLVGPTYDDKGRPYGIWYLGGKSDLNFIQFTFNENIPTDKDIGDIRVSAISYITDEDWPTRLP